MWARSRIDGVMKYLAILCTALCSLGAAAAIFVMLVRVPALASTKIDLLFGTLQAVSVGLLFAIAALLINLTTMVSRANRPPGFPLVGEGRLGGEKSGPSA